jgi:hypothetical protein
MTFTFATPFDDISRIRLEVGDTTPANHRFEDELLTALIAEHGDWKMATVECFNLIIVQIANKPDFQADWLKVSTTAAIPHFKALRDAFMQKHGITNTSENSIAWSASVVIPDRSDRIWTNEVS